MTQRDHIRDMDKLVLKAIENAVHAAIREVGMQTVRQMSMFPSAQATSLKKAA